MKRAILIGGGLVLAAGGVAWMLTRGKTGSAAPGGSEVRHLERANGVDGRLLNFLDWWRNNGPFPIVILAGLRTEADQQAEYAKGRTAPGSIVTYAAHASETAHGHGGALDLGAYDETDTLTWDWSYYRQIGDAAKALGLRWGGDFVNLKDGPHVEVPDWRDLPMPSGNVA